MSPTDLVTACVTWSPAYHPQVPVCIALLHRGGGKSGDHVDVLGNYGLLDILLSVAAGRYEEVEEKVVSNIDEIAAKIPF